MKLYYNPLSTYSQKVMLAFNEKGLTYTPKVVNLMSPEARAAYEQVNAIGKVPFLVADDGRPVPESTIIIEFLEDRFPNTPRLIPTGDSEGGPPGALRRPAGGSLLQRSGRRAAVPASRHAREGQGQGRPRPRSTSTSTTHWDARLAKQPWLCGERFTMADCAAIPVLYYAQEVAPFSDYANVIAYWQRAQQRPSYARVRAEFEPLWQGMLAQMKGT